MGAVCCQKKRTTDRGTSHHILRIIKRGVLFIVDIKNYCTYKISIFLILYIWEKYFFPWIKYFFTILWLYINSGMIIFLSLRNFFLCFNMPQCPIIHIQDFIIEKACPHLKVSNSFMRETHSMNNRGGKR